MIGTLYTPEQELARERDIRDAFAIHNLRAEARQLDIVSRRFAARQRRAFLMRGRERGKK